MNSPGGLLTVAFRRQPLLLPHRRIVRSLLPDVAPPNVNYVEELHSGRHRYPERPAVIDGPSGTAFSFTQLRQATLSVASALRRQHGFGRGHVLSLFTHNRPEFIFALHGAIAAGGAASPVNCHFTAPELAHPLRDAAASVLVTDRERLPVVREAARAVPSLRHVYLIGETEAASRALGCRSFDQLLLDDGGAMGGECAEVDADNDIAVLPYSSGTTGLPKGVMLSHNNVGVGLRQSEAGLRNRIAHDVALGAMPLSHMYGFSIITGNIFYTGGTLVTMPRFEPESFLRLIDTHKVNFLHVVPPLVHFLLQSPLVAHFNLSSLELVTSSGAPLGIEAERAIADKFPKFFQASGMTEMSMFTHSNLRHDDQELLEVPHRVGSIGRLLSNLECKVVKPDTRRELGPDEEGEMAFRGPTKMKGYLGNPEATALSIDEEGWFYSGDVGRYDADGFFYIIDRLKELIKYKGIQVAPAEVESVLLTHPQILDCAVIGKPDDRAGELPMAFIVRCSEEVTETNIHDFTARLLSDHKQLRGGIRFVKNIPKAPSGKLLRRKLKESL